MFTERSRPVIILCTLALLFGGICAFFSACSCRNKSVEIAALNQQLEAKEAELNKARADLDRANKETQDKQEKVRAWEWLSMASIRPGEGPTSPYARQLMANPQIKGNGIEPFTGNLSDKKAIKKWAGRQATLIAIHNHQIDPQYGREWRTIRVGAIYLLDIGGANPQLVTQYAGQTSQPIQIIETNGPGNNSFGLPGHEKGQPYERLYNGA